MMFSFDAPLFWYRFIFLAELFLAEALTTYTLISIYLIAFLVPIIINAIYVSLTFMAMFGLTLLALKICYAESWINILFCGIIAYTMQHFAYGYQGNFTKNKCFRLS